MYKYSGKIFFVRFPFTDLSSEEVRPALAISESNEHKGIEFLFITTKQNRQASDVLEMPKGLFMFDTVLHLNKRFLLSQSVIKKEVAEVGKEFLEKVLKKLVYIETLRYFNHIHKAAQDQKFVPNKSRIDYAARVFDEKEMFNLMDSSLEFYLTAGRYDKEFCEKLSKMLTSSDLPKVKVLTANSGSSANLLAVSALSSHKLGNLALKKGDEVITVATAFPTTVGPILQRGLVPVFVDIEPGTYNIDKNLIEPAISEKTRAIFLAHTLGMPFDLDKILELAEKYRLWVIEDNCDALGAEYTLSREYRLIKNKTVSGAGYTGTFCHIGTSSFYPPHQMTMGEGGAAYTSDADLYRILLSFRDWGKDCWCEPGCDNACGKRFGWKLGKLPKGYDHKYIYSHMGYNFKITDMQAAIGVAQLDKLPSFIEARRRNWHKFYEGLKDLEKFFILPSYPEKAEPSPFGFVLTLRESAGFAREDITQFLEENKIQTRTVFAGNILRQPAFDEGGYEHRVFGELKNTDMVMNRAFWVGVYPGLREEMIRFVIEKIKEFVKK